MKVLNHGRIRRKKRGFVRQKGKHGFHHQPPGHRKRQGFRLVTGQRRIPPAEPVRLFGVVFVESTEAKVFSQSVLTTVSAHTAGSAVVTLADMPELAALYLVSGAKIKIGSTEYTVASADATAKTVTLSVAVASAIAAGTIVFSEDAGEIDETSKKGIDIHATLVFGADAYGIIDVDGEGCMQTIVKPVGSGGASDPLDQRATVGAKVAAYTAKILNNLWIVRIEHGVSL